MPVQFFLVVAAALFCIGVTGVLIKRNALIIFMSIEMMLNAVNLTFVAFSHYLKILDGHVFVFFVMAVAAAEVAIGLAIIVRIARNSDTVNVDQINLLKW